MNFFSTLSSDPWIFTWIILPFLIFVARIMDQTIGTMRLIFLAKGMKFIAPFLGFFEVIIWLLAIGQIMQHMGNWISYIAYGAGFATGNYIGMLLEEKLSLGTVIIRVILSKQSPELIDELKAQDFGLTLVDAEGSKGKVKVVFSIIRRKELPNFIDTLHRYNANAFYTVEEVKSAKEGIFRQTNTQSVFGSFAARLQKSK